MEGPVELSFKRLPNVTAMQFTGDNTSAFMEWLRKSDRSIISCTVHHDYPVVGHIHHTDGSTIIPAAILYLVVTSRSREYRLHAGQWVVRSSAGFLSAHNDDDIKKKYDVVEKS